MESSQAYKHLINKEFNLACQHWIASLQKNAFQLSVQNELALARKDIMQMDISAAAREDFVKQWELIDGWFGIEKDKDVLVADLANYSASPFSILIYDEYIYISDETNHRLLKIDMDGRIANEIGSKGQDPGKFWYPAGLEIIPSSISTTEDLLVCCDCWNHRLQIFSLSGDFKQLVGGFGEQAHEFKGPYDMAFSNDGCLWVADRANHRIKKVSLQGDTIEILGSAGREDKEFFGTTIERIKHDILLETIPAKFEYPGGIWINDSDKVIISDRKYTFIELDGGKMRSYFGNTGPIMPRNLTGDHHRLLVKDEVTHDLYCISPTGFPICQINSDLLLFPLRNTCNFLTLDNNGRFSFYGFKKPETYMMPPLVNITSREYDLRMLEYSIKVYNENIELPDQGLEMIIEQIPADSLYDNIIFPVADLWVKRGTKYNGFSSYITEYINQTERELLSLSDKVFDLSNQQKILHILAKFNRLFPAILGNCKKSIAMRYASFIIRLLDPSEFKFFNIVEFAVTNIYVSDIIAETKMNYLNLFNSFWDNKDYSNAFSGWEKLLSIDPANKAVHQRLKGIIDS